MTHERNIIACSIDLMVRRDQLRACLRINGVDSLACTEFADAFTTALDQLGTALKAAGLDWQDEATWERLKSGQWVST